MRSAHKEEPALCGLFITWDGASEQVFPNDEEHSSRLSFDGSLPLFEGHQLVEELSGTLAATGNGSSHVAQDADGESGSIPFDQPGNLLALLRAAPGLEERRTQIVIHEHGGTPCGNRVCRLHRLAAHHTEGEGKRPVIFRAACGMLPVLASRYPGAFPCHTRENPSA